MLSLGEDKAVILESSDIPLQQLNGLEIVVFGRQRKGPFRWPVQYADSFFVRAIGKVPARDGILRRGEGRDVLELRNGQRLTIGHLPDLLAKANGMRVWLAGPLDAPVGAGIIDPFYKPGCNE